VRVHETRAGRKARLIRQASELAIDGNNIQQTRMDGA
jgi:hypothetical protein